MEIDVSTTDKLNAQKDAFRLIIKKLKVLDALGIEWIPYRRAYVGVYDTYDLEVLLPKEDCVIFARVKLPQFDDGRVRYIHQGLATQGGGRTRHEATMTRLFNAIKERAERGEAIFK